MTEEQIRSWISTHVKYWQKNLCTFTERHITVMGNLATIKVNKNQKNIWVRDNKSKCPFKLRFIGENVSVSFFGVHRDFSNFSGMEEIYISGDIFDLKGLPEDKKLIFDDDCELCTYEVKQKYELILQRTKKA